MSIKRLNIKSLKACYGLIVAIFIAAQALSATASENIIKPDYKKTFDNIPADWREFYLPDDDINKHRGEEVDRIYMTKITYGQPGNNIKIAGGHWFTVIGKKQVLLKDETGETHLMELRYCKQLKRAKYIPLSTNGVNTRYKRSSALVFTTRYRDGYARCDIKHMYKWNGPTYYLDDIDNPIRTVRPRRGR